MFNSNNEDLSLRSDGISDYHKLPKLAELIEERVAKMLTWSEYQGSRWIEIGTNGPLERITHDFLSRPRLLGVHPSPPNIGLGVIFSKTDETEKLTKMYIFRVLMLNNVVWWRGNMQRKKFIIYAPEFNHQSAGNVMLYFLNQGLNELGETSNVVLWGEKPGPINDNTIVIYPEVVTGNPLSARYVARYLLNSDGAICGQKIDRSYRQYLFTYDPKYEKNIPVLTFDLSDLSLLNFADNPECRQLRCVYVGKGHPLSIPVDGTLPYVIMSRNWPDQRELLFNFLKISRFIYLSDPHTAIATEALLCGCIPIILDWGNMSEKEKIATNFLYKFTYEQDFSCENVLFQSEVLRQIIKSRQDAWPHLLKLFVDDIQNFFA